MVRNSARCASRKTASLRSSAALVGLSCGALLVACRSREPAATVLPTHPPAPVEASAAPRVEAPALRLPPVHTFELPDDAPIDPAEADEALRHNCCDEMPASEVQALVHAADTQRPAPTRRRRKKPR